MLKFGMNHHQEAAILFLLDSSRIEQVYAQLTVEKIGKKVLLFVVLFSFKL